MRSNKRKKMSRWLAGAAAVVLAAGVLSAANPALAAAGAEGKAWQNAAEQSVEGKSWEYTVEQYAKGARKASGNADFSGAEEESDRIAAGEDANASNASPADESVVWPVGTETGESKAIDDKDSEGAGAAGDGSESNELSTGAVESDPEKMNPASDGTEADVPAESDITDTEGSDADPADLTEEMIPAVDSEVEAMASTAEALKQPELIFLKLFDNGSTDKAVLKWKSSKDVDYRVLRKKPGGEWKTIGGVVATGSTSTYTDKGLDPDQTYIYTVRSRIRKEDKTYEYSTYDGGIATIPGMIRVTISVKNLYTTLSWESMESSTVKGLRYTVSRGFEGVSETRTIAKVKGTSYTDNYHNTFNDSEKSKCLNIVTGNEYMIDPSCDPVRYEVRPRKEYSSGKISYGKYASDGIFKLSMPVITQVKKGKDSATVTWGKVPYAEKYLVYIGKKTGSGMKWVLKATVPASGKASLSANVPVVSGYPFITVKAKAHSQGKQICSPYDTGYRIDMSKYAKKNILFLGDSIFYGVPYSAEYSLTNRVRNLLGSYVYDGSISGGSYTDFGVADKTIPTDSVEKILNGENPCERTWGRNGKITPKKLSEYDVIVLGGGTNDFGCNSKLGSADSSDSKTFNGGLNVINGYIKQANNERVKQGKAPVKVIYIKLFFRYKLGKQKYGILYNCDMNTNRIGLSLPDYTNAVKERMKDLKKSGIKTYYFDTEEFINADNCLAVSYDNLHLNRVTYAKIGNKMARKIEEILG